MKVKATLGDIHRRWSGKTSTAKERRTWTLRSLCSINSHIVSIPIPSNAHPNPMENGSQCTTYSKLHRFHITPETPDSLSQSDVRTEQRLWRLRMVLYLHFLAVCSATKHHLSKNVENALRHLPLQSVRRGSSDPDVSEQG